MADASALGRVETVLAQVLDQSIGRAVVLVICDDPARSYVRKVNRYRKTGDD
jgi:hypothetical protein